MDSQPDVTFQIAIGAHPDLFKEDWELVKKGLLAEVDRVKPDLLELAKDEYDKRNNERSS